MWGRPGLCRWSSLPPLLWGQAAWQGGCRSRELRGDTRLASPRWCHLTALLSPFTWTHLALGTIARSVISFRNCCLARREYIHIPRSLRHLVPVPAGPCSPGEESPDLCCGQGSVSWPTALALRLQNGHDNWHSGIQLMSVPFLPHHLGEVTRLGILSYPPPHSFVHSLTHSCIAEPLPKAHSMQPSEMLAVSSAFLCLPSPGMY